MGILHHHSLVIFQPSHQVTLKMVNDLTFQQSHQVALKMVSDLSLINYTAIHIFVPLLEPQEHLQKFLFNRFRCFLMFPLCIMPKLPSVTNSCYQILSSVTSVPTVTLRYLQLPSDTVSYYQIPSVTIGYHQLPAIILSSDTSSYPLLSSNILQ